ncbi:hypothetical protein [Halobellus ruber]|uniref:Uncharacterized protein n=1 Tax=Halobellus ruber TaxID=2761102 RepID=A0A7J9SHI2_9EURY|nr:hypothetical protein [Halobellus ruber]MBB6645952.1 hypothetical protein [Halobellus ruber]
MSPRRSFWIAILAYGALSAAAFLPPTDLPSTGGGIGGVLVAASAGYALLRRDRVGGPEEWNLAVLAAIVGAVLYAVVTVLGAV